MPAAEQPPADGATTVLEAPTAEAALGAVHERFGADARVLDARRVLRGGVGGFFAKEHVQLHVAPPGAPDLPRSEPPGEPPSDPPVDRQVDRPVTTPDPPVTRLLAASDDAGEEEDFATYLRRTASIPPTQREVPSPPKATVGQHAEEPAWSRTALARLGLPATLLDDLELRSHDDLGWTTALAQALGPLCRPLPNGPGVLVGPGADQLVEATGTPVARSRAWLEALGSDRWRHLVIGGDGWREHLELDPLAVSWSESRYLPTAVRCAAELGLVLGFGPLDGAQRRARPLPVALAVRSLMREEP
ncbi:MAG: hypothetical protein ACLFRD_03605 [Nitriliruptoraceae bacterium]